MTDRDDGLKNPMRFSIRNRTIDIEELLRHSEFDDKLVTEIEVQDGQLYVHWEWADDRETERPTDDDGYTTRILTEPPENRERFSEWAGASGFPGDIWELVGPDGEVVERFEYGNTVSMEDSQ